MTRILVVDDEPQILRALRINLHRPPVRRRHRRRRRRGAARRPPTEPPRPGRARPRPARHRRRRGHPPPAHLDPGARSSCCPAGSTAATRSTPSTPAPTTTSPNRSASTNCSPGSGPSPAATATPSPPAPVRIGRYDVDLADRTVQSPTTPTRPCTSPAPSGSCWRSWSATPASWSASASCCSEVWGPTYLNETHYLRQYMAQLRRKLEDDPARPRAPAHRARHGLPLPAVSSELKTSPSATGVDGRAG